MNEQGEGGKQRREANVECLARIIEKNFPLTNAKCVMRVREKNEGICFKSFPCSFFFIYRSLGH